MKYLSTLFISVAVSMVSCNSNNEKSDRKSADTCKITEQNTEAREDSLKMVEALNLQSKFANIVTADHETTEVDADVDADAADDPAIWINHQNPEKSLIIGTDKKKGLHVYSLTGEELQFVAAGKINNVDVRYGLIAGNKKIDIAAGTNRTDNTIVIYAIDSVSCLLSKTAIGSIKTKTTDIYGFCLYQNSETKTIYAFSNGKEGLVEQWELRWENDSITGTLIREMRVGSQPEGMVADDETGILYVGVEEEGIFMFNAQPNPEDVAGIIIANSDETNPNIKYDIEGLAIYRKNADTKYLIASSQGNFSYSIFKLGIETKYLTSFVVKAGATIDGVEETDGIEIINYNFGENFADGIFVAQDGFNYKNGKPTSQNFKIVSASKILEFIKE